MNDVQCVLECILFSAFVKGFRDIGAKVCINISHIRHGLHRNVLWEKVFDIVNGGEWTMDDIEMMIQMLE